MFLFLEKNIVNTDSEDLDYSEANLEEDCISQTSENEGNFYFKICQLHVLHSTGKYNTILLLYNFRYCFITELVEKPYSYQILYFRKYKTIFRGSNLYMEFA